jgi:Ser/Thr protein kinase RdoA (MazF antagonist)
MDLVSHSPDIDPQTVARLLRDTYGIEGKLHPLPSERDQNFLITTENADEFVLKIANRNETRSFLEAQNEALIYLASQLSFSPRLIPTRDGSGVTEIESGKDNLQVRLVSYIEGEPLGRVEGQDAELLTDLGRKLGAFDRVMESFERQAFHRDFHWDLSNGLRVLSDHAGLINDNGLRLLIEAFAERFAADFVPVEKDLRRSVIHGDANDYNVIVRGNRVVGLIDFGDMVHSYTVGDLAIAMAYVVTQREPLSRATAVVSGYLKEKNLNELELRVLWDLTLLRLCMSVCLSAYQQSLKPDNDYLSISQQSIRESLRGLMEINSDVAAKQFQLSSMKSGRTN